MSLPRANATDRVGGQQGIRRQEGLDGLAKRARLLFLWNRRPRIAATNPQCNPPLRDLGGQWFCWSISEGTGVLVPLFGSSVGGPFLTLRALFVWVFVCWPTFPLTFYKRRGSFAL
jgi:hypothetical protein